MSDMELIYNVYCTGCGETFSPPIMSDLWREARKKSREGVVDILRVDPLTHGCINAPHYRVIGYHSDCADFDYGFTSIVQAAKTYLDLARAGAIVILKGGSKQTEKRLRQLEWSSV
jgi:hypothetical protein